MKLMTNSRDLYTYTYICSFTFLKTSPIAYVPNREAFLFILDGYLSVIYESIIYFLLYLQYSRVPEIFPDLDIFQMFFVFFFHVGRNLEMVIST